MKTYTEYLKFFLHSRGLDGPDGRPLYAYKISIAQFEALKTLLKDNWESRQFRNACFVLYAVEFLRLEFNDGHLNWSAIFGSIERNDANTPQNRTAIIQSGFDFWRRQLFVTEYATEYIESLRAEAGLPNSCLGQGDIIAKLITRAFQYLESFHVEEEELLDLISQSSLVSYLPQVLRQDNFFQLVANLSVSLLKLKLEYQISSKDNPLEYLKRKHAGWKEQLPINISGEVAEGFFENLLSDIAKSQPLQSADPFKVIHTLEVSEDGFNVRSFLELSEGTYDADAFGIPMQVFEGFPNQFKLVYEEENSFKQIAYLAKTGGNQILINAGKVEVPNLIGKEWTISFFDNQGNLLYHSDQGENFWITSTEPMVFVEQNETWKYFGNGNLRLKEDRARIVVPQSYSLLIDEAHTNEERIDTDSQLKLFVIDADATLKDEESGEEYWVKLRQDNPTKATLAFANQNVNAGNIKVRFQNRHVLVGAPKVYLKNRVFGINERFIGTIQRSTKGGGWEEISLDEIYGKSRCRFINKDGEVIGYKSLQILPSDFRVRMNERNASLEIASEDISAIHIDRNVEGVNVTKLENSFKVEFDPIQEGDSSSVNVMLHFDDFDSIAIILPNPRMTETFVNTDGKIIRQAQLVLNELAGYSLQLNNASERNLVKTYYLQLSDPNNTDLNDLVIKKTIQIPGEVSIRIPIYKWKNDMDRLFAMTESVGARVLIPTGRPNENIQIQRHHLYAHISEGIALIKPESEPGMKLLAMPLSEKIEKEKIVEISYDTIGYNLEEQLTKDGLWILFHSEDSSRAVRPFIFRKGEKPTYLIEEIEHISETAGMDYETRKEKLIAFFDKKFCELDDPAWAELYTLYDISKHLSLDTFDVWKALVNSEKGMLTFMLSDYGDETLMESLSIQFNFDWHRVHVEDWQRALESWYLKNYQSPYFSHLFPMKLDFIKNELGFSLITVLLNNEVPIIKSTDFRDKLMKKINGDFQNNVIGLRARNAEGTIWPSHASDFIQQKYMALPESVKEWIPGQFFNWQKPVIYTPIIVAYSSIHRDFISDKDMDKQTELGLLINAEFDQEYFQEAYALAQTYFYSLTQHH